jgi:hypothetical protein
MKERHIYDSTRFSARKIGPAIVRLPAGLSVAIAKVWTGYDLTDSVIFHQERRTAKQWLHTV